MAIAMHVLHRLAALQRYAIVGSPAMENEVLPQPKRRITPQEYLELERKAEIQSEYFDGEMFALSEYFLVSQTECRIERYSRQSGDTWLYSESADPNGSIELTPALLPTLLRRAFTVRLISSVRIAN